LDPLFCNIGDVVEFHRGVLPQALEDEPCLVIGVGDRYEAVGFVGSGWDLKRVSGGGPAEIRLLNSQMSDYVKVVVP